MAYIQEKVHELYWKDDINCARTMLICLGELFDVKINSQTLYSAIGLHGAGGFRAQCGLTNVQFQSYKRKEYVLMPESPQTAGGRKIRWKIRQQPMRG